MGKQLLTLCLALAMAIPAMSEGLSYKQKITINGESVDKIATELTFDGDNVILHYSDQTTQAVDMSEVSISFDDETTGINGIHTYILKGSTNGLLNIDGLTPGEKVQVFDVSGRKIVDTIASDETKQVDITGTKAGTYILRAGNNVVKFIKK